MTIAPEQRHTGKAGDDRAVVEAVRAGAIGQFAALYHRYHAEALRIAGRQAGGRDEAQDLVQETFARVLRAIQNGGGPTEDVPGYIFRTLRNLRIDRSGRREYATENIEATGPAALWSLPDRSDEVLNRGLVAHAFQDLPPRWREVLWLTEVEGLGPGELSEELGMKPTAVSTLSLRARAGFRSAWLQAHVNADVVPDECRPFVARLGDYETGRLSRRRSAQVQEHLGQCDHCPALLTELAAASQRLGAVLLPVLFLAPKALWWVFGGWAVKAGFLLWGAKAGLTRLRDPKVAGGTVAAVAVAGVAAALAVATVAPPEVEPQADPPATHAAASSAGAGSQGSSDDGGSSAPDSPAPTPSPPPADTQTDAPVVPDRPRPSVAPPARPDHTAKSEPPAQQGVTPAPAPTPAPTPTPTPTPNDTPTQEPPAPPAPQVTSPQSGEPVTSLAVAGTAVPGATVTVRDDSGSEVASVVADDDGTWQANLDYTPPPEGQEPQGDRAGGGGGKSIAGRMLHAALWAAASDDDSAASAASSAAVEGSGDADDDGGADRAEGEASEGADDDVSANAGDDGSEGTGDGGQPEEEADPNRGGQDSGVARFYTVTQSVPDGESGDYTGASDPIRIGPYHWQAPQLLCPVDGGAQLHGVVGGTRWVAVRFRPSERGLVEFAVDDTQVAVQHRGPGPGGLADTCGGLPGGPTTAHVHLHNVEVDEQYTLTAWIEDEETGAAGREVTIEFTVESPIEDVQGLLNRDQ